MPDYIQKYLGIFVGIGAIVASLIQLAATVDRFNIPVSTAVFVPSVLFVFIIGVVFLLTGFIKKKISRFMQVLVLYLTAYGSCLSVSSGDLTYLVFFSLGTFLAMEYGFLDKYFIAKASTALGLLVITLVFGMLFLNHLSFWVVIHSLLGAAVVTAVFYLLLRANLQRYAERTKNLEEIIVDRTRKLQEELKRRYKLTVSLKSTLAEKNQLLTVKEKLLKEIHHRTKNNMQLISSFLNLERSYHDEPYIVKILGNSIYRIKTLALAHELLYKSDDLSTLNLKAYLEKLTDEICADTFAFHVQLLIDVPPDIDISLDFATPLGLLLNELLTNTQKHAFTQQVDGKITIQASITEGLLTLVFQDNGAGVPDTVDRKNPKTLGFQLIAVLVQQVKGQFSLQTKDGTAWTFSFPWPQKDHRA